MKAWGNVVFDKTTAPNKLESKELSRKAIFADWYISGTNAISGEGHIVNIDHTGNRVAAMIYGPEKVIVVVGVNKIEDSLYRYTFFNLGLISCIFNDSLHLFVLLCVPEVGEPFTRTVAHRPALLGHKSSKTTEVYYTHVTEKDIRRLRSPFDWISTKGESTDE